MIKHITIGVAALALGAALATAPAIAQQQTHYGKPVNDGGPVDEPNATAGQRIYNSATPATPSAPAAPHYGKAVNDGGPVDEPSAAQNKAAQTQNRSAQQQPQTPPHYGRPLNDGGF
jgi:hypothetical protein